MARRRQSEATVGQVAQLRGQAQQQSQHADELWLQAQRTAQRRVRQARKHRAEGRVEDAIAELRAAICSFPTASAHLNLASALVDLGRGDEAFAEYLRALQIDPHPTDRYVELGVAFQRAGMMESLLAPFVDTFGPAPLEALRAAAILDPVKAFLRTRPEHSAYIYQHYLECFFEDLRPARVWEALSLPTEDLVHHLMGLRDQSSISPMVAGEAIRTGAAFLRFIRDLGFLPDVPELEWVEEGEADHADPHPPPA
jgi:tetratricopeptide (TPR) repeat protein